MPRPRLLVPSRILRTPPKMIGGGRQREDLVEQARHSIAKGSKSFAAAAVLLDKPTREKTWLLYAWCRRCDDIADGQQLGSKPTPEGDQHHRIEVIRVLTQRALEGQPTADVAFDAFGQVALDARFSPDMAEDVIAGFALDIEGWRPRTEADLMAYCYLVAGAVGIMMARVMGIASDDSEMLDRACDLGLAFQLVNIARDVGDDAAAGRCYLPVEWLAEADIPPGEHMKPPHRDKLVPLVGRLLDMAELHEAAARFGAAKLPLRQRWAVLAAANIYGAIGRKVQRGPKAWDKRVRVRAPEKAVHVAQALVEALRPAAEPEHWPRWTRGQILLKVRMEGPVAPMPMTPLPDEDAEE